MDVLTVIEKYYEPGSKAHHFLVSHSRLVAKKALRVAGRVKGLRPDVTFIEEASMLHDIGIFMTNAPKLGCYGRHPYISHGYLGREILEQEGLPRHALVCERHVGLGLTVEDIRQNNFPLPMREMVPLSIEEKIICFADKFYTKSETGLEREKPVHEVRQSVSGYGKGKAALFEEWLALFRE